MRLSAPCRTLLIDSGTKFAAVPGIYWRFIDLADLMQGRLSVVDIPSDLHRPNEQLVEVHRMWIRLVHSSADTPLA
jgi:hypothetical protein